METSAALDAWRCEIARPTVAEDRHFVAQAAGLFECAGVHLPERQARGIDPVARLRDLHATMPGARVDLYHALLAIFAAFGDRHSRCMLPAPWNDRYAYLPFVAAACIEDGAPVLLVTRSASDRLRAGDRLVEWNGCPIDEVVQAHAAWQLGANAHARYAKAVQTLTVRPLALLPPPEGTVELATEGPSGRQITRFAWQTGGTEAVAGDLAPEAPVDPETGWIRIPSLRTPPEQFLPWLAKQLDRQPSDGCVLDLRGCEDGFVQTAERMLRLFTHRKIDPLRFEMRATPWIAHLVRRCPALSPWQASVAAAFAERRPYSAGLPLTRRLDLPEYRYRGRLLVIVDALTYSSAEMFAAGVQDHGIGLVLGVAPRTGGGGGSAWSQELVHRLSGDAFFARPSGAAGLRMAVLRCRRTGLHAGRLIEGEGIVPDLIHSVTRRDLLCADADLVEHARQVLESMP